MSECKRCGGDVTDDTAEAFGGVCPDCEEIDRAARDEVERGLHSAGIIEDPDVDGGILG